MSPSQRKKYDEARIREKEEKRIERMGGIGPGSYEPSGVSSSRVNMTGSTAFRSTTPRSTSANGAARPFGADSMLRDISMNNDPGAYNPDEGRNFKATSERAFFRKQNKAGTGSFGALSARKLKQDLLGEETPCPTTYADEHQKGMAQKANRMHSAAFYSNSSQRPKPETSIKAACPPPGAYHPKYDAVDPLVRNAASSLKSQHKRFHRSGTNMNLDGCTSETTGPGAYSHDHAKNGGPATIEGKMQRSKSFGRSTSFRTTGVRDLTGAFFAHEAYF